MPTDYPNNNARKAAIQAKANRAAASGRQDSINDGLGPDNRPQTSYTKPDDLSAKKAVKKRGTPKPTHGVGGGVVSALVAMKKAAKKATS